MASKNRALYRFLCWSQVLIIIVPRNSTSTTFLICTAVRSIVYTKYFEVLPGTFFSDFDSELCTAVLVLLFFRFKFINKNSAGERESEATDDETTRTVAKWGRSGPEAFFETKEVSCLLLLSFYLTLLWLRGVFLWAQKIINFPTFQRPARSVQTEDDKIHPRTCRQESYSTARHAHPHI